MSCQPSFIRQSTRQSNDCCERSWRDRSNEMIANYQTNFPARCELNPGYLCEPGMNDQIPPLLCDNIGTSSDMRNGCMGNVMTHTGSRQQLRVRPFRSTPYMGTCRAPLMDSDTYSALISGEQTRTGRTCNSLSGVTIDRFTPLVPCLQQNIQDPVHYIPQYWVRGGMDTRAYLRNADYLKACGIKRCITPCEKSFCAIKDLTPQQARQRGQTANLPCLPDSCVINSRC